MLNCAIAIQYVNIKFKYLIKFFFMFTVFMYTENLIFNNTYNKLNICKSKFYKNCRNWAGVQIFNLSTISTTFSQFNNITRTSYVQSSYGN